MLHPIPATPLCPSLPYPGFPVHRSRRSPSAPGSTAWPGGHSPDGDLAAICGADSWTEVELFGRQKQTWLTTFLELPYGIPAHGCFWACLRLEPQPLEGCFTLWVPSLAAAPRVQVVTVDGKEARRAHDAGRGGRSYTWSALRRTRHVWS